MSSDQHHTEQLLINPPEGVAIPVRRNSSIASSIKMPKTKGEKVKDCIVENLLITFTVIGVLGGVAFGMILRNSKDTPWKHREIMYVDFTGQVFLSMLKSLILPLIVSSIVSAIGSLDLSLSGRIGGRAILYYVTTTISAIILGMILSSTIHPGTGDVSSIKPSGTSRNVTTPDTLMDLIRNMFPPNLVQACIFQTRTTLIPPKEGMPDIGFNITEPDNSSATNTSEEAPGSLPAKKFNLHEWEITQEFTPGMNILGLVVFAVVLGITLSKMGPKGAPLLDFFTALGAAMMIITNWVIWISPIGVFFLITGKVLEMDSFDVIVGQLGMYFLTVVLGLFIHGFIVLPIYYTVCTKKLPFVFIANMSQALATAFGTGSSNATLPIAMGCLEDKNHIDPRVTRFVMPIGATINMDGTALYEAIAAIFISQVRNRVLSLGQLLAVSVTATAASIGAAGIPQAGLVTMVMVLDTVGLPAEDVTLIIAVDWLLDRFRTTINVLGDSLGAGIVAHLSRNELAPLIVPDESPQDPQNGKAVNPEQVEWHTTAM